MVVIPPEAVATAVSKVDNLGLAERSILVYNLLNSVTMPMMYTLFENSGPVEHVVLRPSPEGNSQIAMVLFAHKPSVRFAVQSFDNCLFCGQVIRVTPMSVPIPKLSPPPPPKTKKLNPEATPFEAEQQNATDDLLEREIFKVAEPQSPTLITENELQECKSCEMCKMFRARYNGEISFDEILEMLPPLGMSSSTCVF